MPDPIRRRKIQQCSELTRPLNIVEKNIATEKGWGAGEEVYFRSCKGGIINRLLEGTSVDLVGDQPREGGLQVAEELFGAERVEPLGEAGAVGGELSGARAGARSRAALRVISSGWLLANASVIVDLAEPVKRLINSNMHIALNNRCE
jgi:hypothetical protein